MIGHTATLIRLGLVGLLLCQGCGRTFEDPTTGIEARYQWETLRAELDQSIAAVYPAARNAACDLDLRLLRDEVDGIAATIMAVDAHFDTVNILLEALPDSRTLLTIRISLFGDENKSVVLFRRIMQTLAEGPQVADPRGPRWDSETAHRPSEYGF